MKSPWLAILLMAPAAFAKDVGVRTPGGARIYTPNEQFSQALEQGKRRFVLEVVAGSAAQGNIGALAGWLNAPFRGLEWYAGIGFEANPARQLSLEARIFPLRNAGRFRPYLSLGYVHRNLYGIGVRSHNAALEIGHAWKIHKTYHFSVGVGIRRTLHVGATDDSPLRTPDVDSRLLDTTLRDVPPYTPTFALRFSRAF